MNELTKSSRNLPSRGLPAPRWLTLILIVIFQTGTGSYALADFPNNGGPNSILELSESNYQFVRIGVDRGLSQPTINDIVQDQQGFLWVATQEGLNRYNGYEFKTYFHEPQDPSSLNHDYVWSLFVDSAGVLWVGTDGGGLSR